MMGLTAIIALAALALAVGGIYLIVILLKQNQSRDRRD